MSGLRARFEPIQRWFESLPERIESSHNWINDVFGPTLRTIFKPTNDIFTAIPEASVSFVSTESAVLLFQLAVVWFLKPEYVNVDRPNKRFWTDLRLWTILSMLPHMYIYRVF